MHLAYAFAQKNRLNGVTMTDMKLPCVLLCAPSDAALDTALCTLAVRWAMLLIACHAVVCLHTCFQVCACLWMWVHVSGFKKKPTLHNV